jgi:hypothetical protein
MMARNRSPEFCSSHCAVSYKGYEDGINRIRKNLINKVKVKASSLSWTNTNWRILC